MESDTRPEETDELARVNRDAEKLRRIEFVHYFWLLLEPSDRQGPHLGDCRSDVNKVG
jgi:hypothetical protein